MKERHPEVLRLTQGAAIAALYVVLTLIFAPISFGPVQLRIAEMLTILPLFTSAAVPGLFIGCLLANLLTGCVPLHIVFGTLATLLGAVGTRLMRNKPYWSWIPPVLANTLIVPPVLMYAYGVPTAWPLLALQIFIGEMISVALLGLLVLPGVKTILPKLG